MNRVVVLGLLLAAGSFPLPAAYQQIPAHHRRKRSASRSSETTRSVSGIERHKGCAARRAAAEERSSERTHSPQHDTSTPGGKAAPTSGVTPRPETRTSRSLGRRDSLATPAFVRP
jgi:hypothetical protein